MGAFGTEFFDDDAACDFIADAVDSDNARELFENSFNVALNSDYLDCDECYAVIVSAVFIDALCHGTKYDTEIFYDEEADVNSFDSFVDKNKSLQFSDLQETAVNALKCVLSDDSELNSLWQENEELYPKWRRNVEELIERLT